LPGKKFKGGFGRLFAVLSLLCGLVLMAMPVRAETPPLVAAAERGDAAEVRRLLAAGAAVDGRDDRGRTALLAATHADRPEVAALLIAAKADVNAKDAIQDSPYLYAAAEGRVAILRQTLAAGADLKSTNRYGGTGLIPAAHHGYPEVVRILLGTAIDKDHVNNLGWTALLEAVILGDGGPVHTEIVRLLVDAGARTGIADRDGVTPLQHARKRGYAGMVAILEKAGGR
jgi:ankyrin repeat protein